jgi:hypothetical protein
MPRPLYWKPKYATRSMRHRAWVRQEERREARLLRPPSLLQRVRGFLGR